MWRRYRILLAAQPESHPDGGGKRIPWRRVNPRYSRLARQPRFKVVLGFVVVAIGQVVESEIKLDPAPDPPRNAEIEHRVAAGTDRRIISIQPVMVDRPHPQRSAQSQHVRHRQT